MKRRFYLIVFSVLLLAIVVSFPAGSALAAAPSDFLYDNCPNSIASTACTDPAAPFLTKISPKTCVSQATLVSRAGVCAGYTPVEGSVQVLRCDNQCYWPSDPKDETCSDIGRTFDNTENETAACGACKTGYVDLDGVVGAPYDCAKLQDVYKQADTWYGWDGSTATEIETGEDITLPLAIGLNPVADGNLSLAIGSNPVASGNYSVSIGSDVVASGNYSIAMVSNSIAAGTQAVAIGHGTQALSMFTVAVGRYNVGVGTNQIGWTPTDSIFEVGIGTGSEVAQRANALTILKNGNVGIGTTTPDEKLHVDGNIVADSPLSDDHVVTKGYADVAYGASVFTPTVCYKKCTGIQLPDSSDWAFGTPNHCPDLLDDNLGPLPSHPSCASGFSSIDTMCELASIFQEQAAFSDKEVYVNLCTICCSS